MKKFERKMCIFYITSVPCFVFAAIFFLLVTDEAVLSIITFAFGLFVIYVCSLSWRVLALYSKNASSENYNGEDDDETADREQDTSIKRIEELEKRIKKVEGQMPQHERYISYLMKEQNDKKSLCNKKRETSDVNQSSDVELKTEECSVPCNLEGLVDKKELVQGDKFTIVRNGCGVMALKNFKLLIPNAFEKEKRITPNMHDQWKAYNMGILFDLNSYDMINYKITKIIPAEIEIVGNTNADRLEGVLMKKGRIELEK